MKPWEKYQSDVTDGKPWEKYGAEPQPVMAAPATQEPVKSAPATRMEKFAKGATDPFDAAAQMLSNALPKDVVGTLNEFNNWLADRTGLVGKLPEGGVNQFISDKEKDHQASPAA